MEQIILASGNENKLREYKDILKPYYEVISQKEAGIDIDPEETGLTYEGNAQIKARAVWALTHKPVMADDSGLEIDALNGKPGIYTKRFAKPGEHIEKILSLMEGVPHEERTARLVCALCFIDKNGEETIVRGVCPGYIAETQRGNHKIFPYNILMQGDKSLAEMTEEERNKISHRAISAMKQIIIQKHLGSDNL